MKKNTNIDEKKDIFYFNILLYFIFLYTLVFFVFAFLHRNYQYIYFSLIMMILLLILRFVKKKLLLPNTIVFGIAIGGLLHMFGGIVYINGIRLYDYPIWVFHYDNFVHTYNSFIVSLLVYNLLEPYLHTSIKENKFLTWLILILMTSGVGTINEIIELIAVLFLNAGEAVGGYLNNAFDLVFNIIGATIGAFVLYIYRKRK